MFISILFRKFYRLS